ncbi:hypothetical protein ACFVUY_43290 [Kitasatospora sp. NPDC058063]|uniref:hypothetical protein n=1 Tax=unclassified Kitasatospora TaxID=2633591 RepID=UPI0036DF3BA6
MTARFGDFVALAAEHLANVDRLPVEDSSELARTALIGQLADFTEIVLGIERRFAWEAVEALPHRSGPAAGIFPPEPPTPVGPRSELHMSLTEAVIQLRTARGTRTAALMKPPQCIPRAGKALRTGIDLLATHTGPDGEPLTRHGLALESDELRCAVLSRVMPLAATAAGIADRLADATSTYAFPRRVAALAESGRKLRVAVEQARILTARARSDGYDWAVDLIAPRAALRADPPRTAETIDRLAAGAVASVDRLTEFAWRALDGDQHHVHTAAAMRTAAADISAVYTVTRTLVAHATLAGPSPEDPGQKACQSAERHWRELAACWRPVRTAPDSTTLMTPVSAESHALVDRLGRILFTDPAWRRDDGLQGRLRDAAELAEALPAWTEALRHISGQLQHLARDHATLTRRMAESHRLLMRASGPAHNRLPVRPLSTARQAELHNGYHLAAQAGGGVEDALADLAARAGVDPAGRRLQRLAAAPTPAATDRAVLRQSAARLAEPQPPQRWPVSVRARFQGKGIRL